MLQMPNREINGTAETTRPYASGGMRVAGLGGRSRQPERPSAAPCHSQSHGPLLSTGWCVGQQLRAATQPTISGPPAVLRGGPVRTPALQLGNHSLQRGATCGQGQCRLGPNSHPLFSITFCHEPHRHPNWPTFTQLLEATAVSRSRGTVVDGCLWEGQGPQSG